MALLQLKQSLWLCCKTGAKLVWRFRGGKQKCPSVAAGAPVCRFPAFFGRNQ
jgi:hypothetical protein